MISVIMASHNGARTLTRTLAAFERIRAPDGGIEFILVDNASTDETMDILVREGQKLNATVLSEPRRGKSYALNSAVPAASGDLVVFTDDDVLPMEDWLLAFATAARRYPTAGMFAGQVRHEWDAPPPKWLEHLGERGMSYGGTPSNLKEGPIGTSVVKGANLMIRRDVLTLSGFDEETNNFVGGGAVGGEDTALVRNLIEMGQELIFVPAACVKHRVRAEQIGLRPVFLRYVRIGKGLARLNRPSRGSIYRRLITIGARTGAALLFCRWYKAAEYMTTLAMCAGMFIETHRREHNHPVKITSQ